MQFARRIFHSTSAPANHTEHQNGNNFVQANQIRAQYQIDVKDSKSMAFNDYLNSVELDPMSRSIVEAHKDKVGPYIYFIDLELKDSNNQLQWTIRKRFTDFIALDGKLYHEQIQHGISPGSIVHLPGFYNAGSSEVPEQFAAAAKEYLAKLLQVQEIRMNSKLFNEFIELSLLPLPQGPRKHKEGHLRKKGGGRFKHNKLKLFLDNAVEHWNERWFMLTHQGIIYAADSTSTKPREIILFDHTFQILYGAKKTGAKLGIFIMTPNRKLYLQGHDVFNTLDWIGEIQKVVKSSPYTKAHRFRSFAPAREATHQCKSYIDAEGYYSDLCDALLQAKSEIFITDWWLTPELMLKRPVKNAESECRLDKVLGKVANTGVRVYIILYHEVKMMMYNDSGHAKKVLQSLSPNIIVLQHPSESFFNWSHHEKLVIIDQSIGFIGGLDLCLGRWDTNNHSLMDPASAKGKGETFFGQDYANPRLVDFRDVAARYNVPLINKTATPRMPFHDAMIKVIGPVVNDMARHFIQYYNHVIVDSYSKKEDVPLPRSDSVTDEATLRKELTRAKFQSGLRKIFLIRHMGGNAIIPYEDRQVPVENVHQIARSFGEVDLLASHANGDDLEIPCENAHNVPRDFGAVDTIITHNKEEAKEAHKDIEPSLGKDIKVPEFGQTGYQLEIHQIPRDFAGLESKKSHVKEEVQEEIQKDLEFVRKKSSFSQKEEPKRQYTEKQDDVDVLLTGRQGEVKEQRAYNKLLDGMREKAISKVGDSLDKDIKIPGLGEINPQHALDNITDHKYSEIRHAIIDKENRETNTQNPSLATAHKQHKFQRLKTKFLGEEKPKMNNPEQDPGKNMLQLLFTPKHKPGTVACQMIRSASKWSLGLTGAVGGVERSIQNAYVELIQNAKHFIYIENQFFMSATAGKPIKNQIGKALLDRIEQAHARKEKFRVVVFLPLLPGFEGEVIDSKSAVLKIEMNWQYKTISRGGTSIYQELIKKGIQPIDYIQFYSLRAHDVMPSGEPVTEIIYIHSKILVIDDDILLIGSANINDRSLQGNGDSEVAMVFEDSKKVKSMMGGHEVQVSEFVQNFRTRLLSEHLGLSEEEVRDPLTQEFMTRMDEITERNTLIFREVFACYPDDTVSTLKELNDFEMKRDPSKYTELAPKIQGHAVWFPLEFLSEESLKASMTTLERYAPNSTFI